MHPTSYPCHPCQMPPLLSSSTSLSRASLNFLLPTRSAAWERGLTAALSDTAPQMEMGPKSQLVGNSDGQSTRANSSARESAEASMPDKHSNGGGTTATPYAVLPRMSDPNPSYGPG